LKILVTGSSSTLARLVIASLKDSGHDVIECGRESSTKFIFGEKFEYEKEVDKFLHFAWDRSDEFLSAEDSIELCKEFAEKFVFISTVSATDLSRSQYGQCKRLVENQTLANGGTVLRFGVFKDVDIPGIYSYVWNLLNSKKIIVLPFKNFPLLWVSDTIQVSREVQEILTLNKSGAFNLVQTLPSSLRFLVNEMNSKLKNPCLVIWIPILPFLRIINLLPRTFRGRLLFLEKLQVVLDVADKSDLNF